MPRLFGLLNLDKPSGMSSRDVVNVVQRLVRPAKAGHAGTLDPLATGVLVVCVGPATRLISFLQDSRKTYRATFRFGVASETDDVEGTVVPVPDAPPLTQTLIEAALPEFLGRIEQVPPAYSAVHVGGRRAYDLARRGEEFTLQAKPVDVYRFDVLRFDAATQELVCEIECGSGTYVRSLGRDLARRLGTGAVMTALERTAIGSFRVEAAVPPDQLTRESLETALQPPALALAEYARLDLDDGGVAAVRNGRAVPAPSDRSFRHDETVALFDSDDDFIAVAAFDDAKRTLRPRIVFPTDAFPTE